MQITPVTALPANGVTTGSLAPTAARGRVAVTTGPNGPVDLRVIRQLESGDWVVAKDIAPIQVRKSNTMNFDFEIRDATERLHLLSTGAVPSDATVYMKSIAPSGNVLTIKETKQVRVTNAPAASTTAFVATANIANAAATIAAQPVYPCKMQIKVTDANSSITAGTIVAVYVDAWGVSRSETFNIASQGTKTYTTTWAVAKITSITPTGLVGIDVGTDKIEAGPTANLALPAPATPVPSNFAVYKANVNDVDETVGTVDAVAGTISPTTTTDGTRDYDFWYSYQVAISS